MLSKIKSASRPKARHGARVKSAFGGAKKKKAANKKKVRKVSRVKTSVKKPAKKKAPVKKTVRAKKISKKGSPRKSGGKTKRGLSATRKKELDKIIKNMGAERLFIQERIEKAKRDEWIGTVNDEIDNAVASAERDILFERVDRFIQRLDEIDNALKKAELKRFGVCEKCGSEISIRRLKLIPYARYCYRCISKT